MTVAEAGARQGRLIEIKSEAKLDTDEPELDEHEVVGRINADLTVGTDITTLMPLQANQGISFRGVTLIGKGFIITPAKAKELGLERRDGLERHIRHYFNGRDLLQRPRGALVIDLYGLTEQEVMDRYPEVYQHVLQYVRDSVDEDTGLPNGRSVNRRDSYKKHWWIFGEPRGEQRPALVGLDRYIATTQTSAHRVFMFLPGDILPDQQIIAIASDDPFLLGMLQSSLHEEWVIRIGGWLGVGNDNRYNNSRVFDPFPFPDTEPKRRSAIADIAERLDSTRRSALSENEKLTMTGLYNLVSALRSGTLPPELEQVAMRARARIVAKLHEDLDAAVAAAYGWPADLPPADIVTRLVALNAERAAEEKAGKVRWLRPDYQEPRIRQEGQGRVKEFRDINGRINELIHHFDAADLVLQEALTHSLTREQLGLMPAVGEDEDEQP